jgi:hypothetical protein
MMRGVRRLLRILPNVATVVSLVLCVSAAVLWARSYGGGESVIRARGGVFTCAFSIDGSLGISRVPNCPFEFGVTWGRGLHIYPESTGVYLATGPDGAQWIKPLPDGDGGVRSVPVRIAPAGVLVRLPHWVLVAFLGVAAAARPATRAFLAARAAAPAGRGPCPACGYDCRATPGRCPECGRAVAEGAA